MIVALATSALAWIPSLHAQGLPQTAVLSEPSVPSVPPPATTSQATPIALRPDLFSISGFGTLGVTHSSLRSADYTNTAFEPNGAGHSRRYDFADASIIGVQLMARMTDKLSAVLQIVSQHSYDNSFTPHVEWANIKYAFTPNFDVRVGRVELPTFANSDFRNVGYANPWVRVPVEVYNNDPVTNSDGIDTSYRFGLGAVTNTVHIVYGVSKFHGTPGPIRAKASNVVGVFDTVEYGFFTGHAGYTHANITLDGAPAGYAFQGASSYSVAAAYDPGQWFVQAELARVTVAQITPGYINGYLTAGYRIAAFTPYVTYSQSHSLGHSTISGDMNKGQKEASIGVRWDFARNFDVKAQYDHLWLPQNSTGSLSNIQPDYKLGSGTDVFSVTLDFVF